MSDEEWGPLDAMRTMNDFRRALPGWDEERSRSIDDRIARLILGPPADGTDGFEPDADDRPRGDPVVDYLRGRGLTDEQILERLNANREL